MKEELLGALKKRSFQQHEVQRLQAIILNIVRKADRREFRRYCRVATTVDDERLREELKDLELTDSPDIRRRSGWVLDALRKATRATQNDSFAPKPAVELDASLEFQLGE